MRIAAVRATPVNIPFHAPYRFSLGSTASVTKTIVEIETVDGLTGIGRVRRRRSQWRGRASRRAPDRARPARPQRVRAALRAGVRALAVGERDDAQARVRRDRDGALGSPRPGRGQAAAPAARRRRTARDRVHGVLLPAPSRRRAPGRVDAARGRPLLRAHDRGVRLPHVRGQARDRRAGGRAGDGARGARRNRRPPAATRRERRLDGPTARDVLRRLAPYDIRCIEEPVGSHEELARLRPFTDIAFSAHAPDLRRAVALGMPDFYVLNIVELGGIRRTVEFVARMRDVRHRVLVPLAATPASRAPRTCSCRPRWSRSASPARRSSTGTPTTSSPRGRSARGAASCQFPRAPASASARRRRALARCHERFLAEGPFPVRRGRRAGAHTGLVRRAQALLTVLSDFR